MVFLNFSKNELHVAQATFVVFDTSHLYNKFHSKRWFDGPIMTSEETFSAPFFREIVPCQDHFCTKILKEDLNL
jgi:hypothetical protein